jgi:hypothetical protein
VDELRSYGINAIGCTKGPGSVDHGIKWLADLEIIIIDPLQAPLAAKEFINYALQTSRSGDIISRYPDSDNHAIDSVRYGLQQYIQQSGKRSIRVGAA